MNIGTLLPRHARYRPDHLALVVGNKQLSYRELNLYVNRLSHALLRAGLKRGDRLATVLPNRLELMAAYWAAAKTGMVIVPLSPLLNAPGLASLLNDSDAMLVIGDASFADTFDRIRDQLPGIADDRYVLVGDGINRPSFRSYHDFIAGISEDNPPDPGLNDDDMYNIMYTSGTTGLPKGIVHTHYVRAMYCTLFAETWRMTPESICLHAGSIVFNGAMLDLMPWMFVGGSFNAERVIEDIAKWQVTHVVMVPAQIIAILNSPAFQPKKLASLEMLQSVGAPLHVEHKKKINAMLPGRFYELYGLTEGSIRGAAGATQVNIFAAIGGSDGISAEAFLDQVGKIAGPISLGICSVGGDFFGGMLIADALRRRGGVTAHVTLAASIASAIALSADRVLIGEDGYFMVHAPWATATGDADGLERMAATLRKLKGTLADLYQRETGQSSTTVSKWLCNESWFDAKESLRLGLADALDGQSSLKALIDLSRFKNPPAQLAAPAAAWGRVIAARFVKAG